MDLFKDFSLAQRILALVPDKDLVRLSGTCRSINSFLHNDSFWTSHIGAYKPTTMTCYQYFRSCHQVWTVSRALKENRLDQLQRLDQRPTREDLNDIPLSNNEALQWVIKKNCFDIRDAIRKGDLQLCKILDAGGVYISDWDASLASMCDQYEILSWLQNEKKLIPRPGSLTVACAYGDLKMVEHLYEMGVRFRRWRCGLNPAILTPAAAKRGHVDILEWLYKHECFPTEDAKRAAEKSRQVYVLYWMKDKHLLQRMFSGDWR